ncbi:hypothetical protein [Gilvimarinus polysaccharolyticus]|uniref:hypothetical protein n=1 Tax=Gilvimarinus polysaccharolyticus TaxID=863921 RepID=UPI000673771D|nr:hypothetical protein [Gilvimarinus polysaccharolyticus]
MKPDIYLYNETDKGFELYLGECSTQEGLSLFDQKTELSIVSFGATSYKKYGWATESEIPSLKSVEAVLNFLESEGDVGLVEFEAELPEIGSFSSHDDGECHFIMKSKHSCISALKVALPSQYSDMLINKLVSNPGLYFTCSNSGVVIKYGAFDEFIAKNA